MMSKKDLKSMELVNGRIVFNPHMDWEEQVGSKNLQHINAVRAIFNKIVDNITIERFEEGDDGFADIWWVEFNTDPASLINSILKAFNGMPKQLKPWALIALDHTEIWITKEGDIDCIHIPRTEEIIESFEAGLIDPSIILFKQTPDGLWNTNGFLIVMKGDKIRKVVPLE